MIVAQADAVSVTQLHLLSMIMTQADVVSVTQLLDPYLGPSMARAEEAVAALPSLDVWHRALEGAFASRPKLSPVIPMGFGGNENIDAAAWHGDEAIGSAVAKVVEAKSVKGKDNLTRRYGALASNADLAKRMVVKCSRSMCLHCSRRQASARGAFMIAARSLRLASSSTARSHVECRTYTRLVSAVLVLR